MSHRIYKAKLKNELTTSRKKTRSLSYYVIFLLSSKLSDSRSWSQNNVILCTKRQNHITSNITFNTITSLIHFIIKYRETDLIKLGKIKTKKMKILFPMTFAVHSVPLIRIVWPFAQHKWLRLPVFFSFPQNFVSIIIILYESFSY